MRIAVLDDYQGVALTCADWAPVTSRTGPTGEPCTVDVFRDHVSEPAALIERLTPYDAVVVMRERTPLPAGVLGRLPACASSSRRAGAAASTSPQPPPLASRSAAPRAGPPRPQG